MEAGLDDLAISYSKGCYIGQEVIQRIKTYSESPEPMAQSRLPRLDDLYLEAVRRITRSGQDAAATMVLHLLALCQEPLSAHSISELTTELGTPSILPALRRSREFLQVFPPDQGATEPRYALFHDTLRSWLARVQPDESAKVSRSTPS